MNQPKVIKLTWDSAFFGYPVGEINNPAAGTDLLLVLQTARAAGYRLIYLKSNLAITLPPALPPWVTVGVKDHKIMYAQPLLSAEKLVIPAENIISYYQAPTNPALLQLALISGTYSRFARDAYFNPQDFERLYTQWLTQSVAGVLAHNVWVSTTPTGKICGLLTLKKDNATATIGLLAVLPAYQHHGYGQKLVQTAIAQAQTWGCSQIRVGTQQQNTPANSLYQKTGFTSNLHVFTYHLWLSQP